MNVVAFKCAVLSDNIHKLFLFIYSIYGHVFFWNVENRPPKN